MISDENVRQLFQSKLDTSDGYMNMQRMKGWQIFRGRKDWQPEPVRCVRHKTVFSKFGVIPEECFDCYKVEIFPRTVVELFKLLMVFEKLSLPLDNTRKIMVVTNPNVSAAYKGFVYCESIVEGKELCEIVRNAVSDDISPKVPVTLKRGCSEYALAYPRYAQVKPGVPMMDYRKYWKSKEDFVDKNYVFPPATPVSHVNGTYPPWEIFCMQFYLMYAATIGDMSYLTISGKELQSIPQLNRPPFSSSE